MSLRKNHITATGPNAILLHYQCYAKFSSAANQSDDRATQGRNGIPWAVIPKTRWCNTGNKGSSTRKKWPLVTWHTKWQVEQHREEMARLIAQLAPGQASALVTSPPVAMTTPSFEAFYPMSELWKDYWSRFQICMEANSIPTEREPKAFLTN